MSFLKTTEELVFLLKEILQDIPKALKGNKTAGQRIRLRTIAFCKVAKEWRKASLHQIKKKKSKKTAALRKKKPLL
jgi:hypothetical protein